MTSANANGVRLRVSVLQRLANVAPNVLEKAFDGVYMFPENLIRARTKMKPAVSFAFDIELGTPGTYNGSRRADS